MSKRSRRLGRGLDSLVAGLNNVEAVDEAVAVSSKAATSALESGGDLPVKGARTASLPINAIDPNPLQPRHNIDDDEVLSLTQSIDRSGLLQPIVVRAVGGRYQIVAGERRWSAAKALGWSNIPALIRDATDEQMLELALIENIQREDLNAIDRASAYHEFCNRFSLKPEEVARRLGEDRTTVVNYIRLLDLPDRIQDLVANSAISMGHARCLLGIADADRRLELAESVVDNELSVRALEEIVRRERTRSEQTSDEPVADATEPSAHLVDIQRRFEQVVKTKVVIREGRRKGTGRIVIEYYSLDDFDRVASLLGVASD